MGYHKVHISRLKKIYIEKGKEGMIRKPGESPNKIKENLKSRVEKLFTGKYQGFNMFHFMEKLNENEDIELCYESVRKILIERSVHVPKHRRRVHRKRRKRMPKEGMLIQMDSSDHKWIPKIERTWWLTSTVDDATSKILFMKFYKHDGVYNNMEIIRKIIEKNGVFYALYVDKASHFKTTRLGGLHYNVSVEQEDTQIERALGELDIRLIPANSAQAKGRIERSYRTLQDRLINEMRLYKINSYKKANDFIDNYFINYYNSKFAKHKDVDNVYMPLPENVNLDLVFCKKYARKVNNDNTISFQGKIIQLKPTECKLSFAKRTVYVHLLENNTISITYKGIIILKTKISKNNKKYRKTKKRNALLNQRKYQYA